MQVPLQPYQAPASFDELPGDISEIKPGVSETGQAEVLEKTQEYSNKAMETINRADRRGETVMVLADNTQTTVEPKTSNLTKMFSSLQNAGDSLAKLTGLKSLAKGVFNFFDPKNSHVSKGSGDISTDIKQEENLVKQLETKKKSLEELEKNKESISDGNYTNLKKKLESEVKVLQEKVNKNDINDFNKQLIAKKYILEQLENRDQVKVLKKDEVNTETISVKDDVKEYKEILGAQIKNLEEKIEDLKNPHGKEIRAKENEATDKKEKLKGKLKELEGKQNELREAKISDFALYKKINLNSETIKKNSSEIVMINANINQGVILPRNENNPSRTSGNTKNTASSGGPYANNSITQNTNKMQSNPNILKARIVNLKVENQKLERENENSALKSKEYELKLSSLDNSISELNTAVGELEESISKLNLDIKDLQNKSNTNLE